MDKYRVGFLIRGLCDGGAERVVANLATQYARHNCHTIIITRSHTEGDYKVDDRVKRYELDNIVGDSIDIKTWIKRLFSIRRICKEERLDVLIALMDDSIPYAIVATKFLKTKSIISVRNDPKALYSTKKRQRIVRVLYSFADGAVFQTNEAKEWFSKRLQRKSSVLFNPVNDVFYNVCYAPEDQNVVNTGRLSSEKNQKMLIEAFSLVIRVHKDAKLHIYGIGNLHEELTAQIKKLGLSSSVFLDGRSNEVENVLSKATLFVLSSNFEGSPNALMEAMAVGVPSISTDCPCGGPRMLLGNNDKGLLVPVGDVKALADAIIYMLSNADIRNEYSQKCKNSSLAFSEKAVFNDWNSYINSIIE